MGPSIFFFLFLQIISKIPGKNVAELKTWRIAQLFEKISPLDERRRCLLCGKIICNVRNHYYVHFPGKYSCNLCPAVYTRSDTLLMHSRSKHPEHVI